LGFAVAFASGAAVALLIRRGDGWANGTGWDVSVLRRSHVALPRWMDFVLLVVPWLGTNITIFAVLIPLGILLQRRGRADIVAQIGAVAVGNYLLDFLLKFAFARPRPSIWPRRGEYAWSSYPSGHAIAMMSVLLFAAWLGHRETRALWPFVAWPPLFIMMSFSRVYLGVHWPTDVVGGEAVGVIWLLAAWLAFRRPGWEGPTLAERADPHAISAEAI
jgi:undecaprenyl-diphosphatase